MAEIQSPNDEVAVNQFMNQILPPVDLKDNETAALEQAEKTRARIKKVIQAVLTWAHREEMDIDQMHLPGGVFRKPVLLVTTKEGKLYVAKGFEGSEEQIKHEKIAQNKINEIAGADESYIPKVLAWIDDVMIAAGAEGVCVRQLLKELADDDSEVDFETVSNTFSQLGKTLGGIHERTQARPQMPYHTETEIAGEVLNEINKDKNLLITNLILAQKYSAIDLSSVYDSLARDGHQIELLDEQDADEFISILEYSDEQRQRFFTQLKKKVGLGHYEKAVSVIKIFLTRLESESFDVRPENFSVIHADAHLDNFFIDPEKSMLSIIDYDSLRSGDPMADIGRVMASLQSWANFYQIPEEMTKKLVAQFIDSYKLCRYNSGEDDSDFDYRKAQIYEARLYLAQIVLATKLKIRSAMINNLGRITQSFAHPAATLNDVFELVNEGKVSVSAMAILLEEETGLSRKELEREIIEMAFASGQIEEIVKKTILLEGDDEQQFLNGGRVSSDFAA